MRYAVANALLFFPERSFKSKRRIRSFEVSELSYSLTRISRRPSEFCWKLVAAMPHEEVSVCECDMTRMKPGQTG